MPKIQLITQSQIAERAFEIWEHEGMPHGRDQEHWQRAEAELCEAMNRMTAASGRHAAKVPAGPGKAKVGKTSKASAKNA